MDYGKEIRIHNFVILKHRAGGASFVKVRTFAGDWSVSYREDSVMYLLLDKADESARDGIRDMLVGMYGACNTVDGEFTKELFDSLNRFYGRLQAGKVDVPEEEDAKALDDARRRKEMREEISRCGEGGEPPAR